MDNLRELPHEVNYFGSKRDLQTWNFEPGRGGMRSARGWPPLLDFGNTIVSGDKASFVSRRLARAVESMQQHLDIDPARRSGVPVVKNTRFTVAQLLAQLADGDSIYDLEENFELDKNTLSCILHAFSAILDQPRKHGKNTTG